MTDLVVQPHLDGLLSAIDGEPHLVGGRCGQCATDTFPKQASCPRCGSDDMASVDLPTRGIGLDLDGATVHAEAAVPGARHI